MYDVRRAMYSVYDVQCTVCNVHCALSLRAVRGRQVLKVVNFQYSQFQYSLGLTLCTMCILYSTLYQGVQFLWGNLAPSEQDLQLNKSDLKPI